MEVAEPAAPGDFPAAAAVTSYGPPALPAPVAAAPGVGPPAAAPVMHPVADGAGTAVLVRDGGSDLWDTGIDELTINFCSTSRSLFFKTTCRSARMRRPCNACISASEDSVDLSAHDAFNVSISMEVNLEDA